MRSGLLPCFAAVVVAVACSADSSAEKVDKKTEPVGIAILDYHAQHCEKCHGVEGELHTLGWTKFKTEDELADVLFEMVTSYSGQPRMIPLVEQAFASMHRANGRQEPWGSLIEIKGGTLIFESVKDASFEAKLEGRNLAASKVEEEVKGLSKKMLRWKVVLPPKSDWRKVQVTLSQGTEAKEKKVTWKLQDSSFSHWNKLPDPAAGK